MIRWLLIVGPKSNPRRMVLSLGRRLRSRRRMRRRCHRRSSIYRTAGSRFLHADGIAAAALALALGSGRWSLHPADGIYRLFRTHCETYSGADFRIVSRISPGNRRCLWRGGGTQCCEQSARAITVEGAPNAPPQRQRWILKTAPSALWPPLAVAPYKFPAVSSTTPPFGL